MGRILVTFVIFSSFLTSTVRGEESESTGDIAENYSLDWASLEAFSKSIAKAYKDLGPDQLAEIIRASGVKKDQLAAFRLEVQTKIPEKILQIRLPFTEAELTPANGRLARSGLDFIKLIPGLSPANLYTEIPREDVAKVQQLLNIRRLVAPAVALFTGLTVGLILVKSGQIVPVANTAMVSSPGFHTFMLPFYTAAVGGAIAQSLSNTFLYQGLYHFTETKSDYRPFSFFGKPIFRDFVLSSVLVSVLPYFVAKDCGAPLSYTTDGYGSALLRTAEAMGISFVTLGLAELALEQLKKRGVLSQLNSLRIEMLMSPVMVMGSMIFLTSSYLTLGAGLMSTVGLAVTIPLWYKLLMGDRVYDWYTRKIISGDENNMSFTSRVCGKILGALSRVHRLKK